MSALALTFHPLTADRWRDLEELFGERGAYDGCWCMWWRVSRRQFQEEKGAGNRRAMEGIVGSGDEPGVLAYAAGRPAGWCAVAPRDVYASLNRSRTLKRIDDEPVWSITCFYVADAYRGRGVMASLLRAAVDFATARGAHIVEGYPIEPAAKRVPAGWEAYLGGIAQFHEAGFVEVVRRSPRKPVMRYTVSRS